MTGQLAALVLLEGRSQNNPAGTCRQLELGQCSPCPQKRFILDCEFGIRRSASQKSLKSLKSSPFTNPDPAIEAWAIGVNTACRYVIQLFHFGWMNRFIDAGLSAGRKEQRRLP